MELPVFERLGDARSAAVTWGKIADIAYQRGDYDEALRIRREVQLPVFERLGDPGRRTWGKIADIAYQRGDYDEALRIHREVQLPVYERLGDTRETAVTWGKIADIAYQRGDYDEAAELQRKRLEVCKQLGDLDGIADTDWGLAQIDLAREDYQAAFPRLVESFQIFGRLQRPDGIAVVGMTLGQLLLAAGQADPARQVLGDSLAAATKIGWTDMAQQISELLNPPATSERGHMIIQLEGPAAGNVEAARRSLEALAHGWGYEIAQSPAGALPAATSHDENSKAIDPVSVAAAVLSIPSAALAVARSGRPHPQAAQSQRTDRPRPATGRPARNRPRHLPGAHRRTPHPGPRSAPRPAGRRRPAQLSHPADGPAPGIRKPVLGVWL